MSYFILMTSKLVKTWVRLHPYSIQGILHWIIHRPLAYWPINTLPKQIFQYYVRNFLKTSQLYPFVLQGIEIRYLCELNYRNLESHQDCTAQIYVYGYVITIYPFGPRHCPCEFVYLQAFNCLDLAMSSNSQCRHDEKSKPIEQRVFGLLWFILAFILLW